MPGGKRGLVAPQNTFLENIVRRSSGESVRRSKACYGGGLVSPAGGPDLDSAGIQCVFMSVQPENKHTQSLYAHVFSFALMEFTLSLRLHELL